MLDSALTALSSFADPTMLLYLAAGTIVGLIVGVIPGLGGTGAVAVLIPFVFVLEPNQAIAMIIGAVAVVHTSDVITSVVLGIPGSAAASVFLLDGHKMAQRGQASRALSISFIASTIGGLIGIVALTLVIPVARPLVSAFGSPEIFVLIVLGIYLTAVLSQGNLVKGLMLAVFGLVLGLVGPSPVSAEYRYAFGSEYLMDGVGLVAAALGIFGVAEIIHLVAKRSAIADKSMSLGSGWARGARDVVTHRGEVLRGSLVGVGAGIIPGLGGTAGAWLAYGQAKAMAARKKNTQFGNGDPRGVIAPSAASNGIESGSLIPTLLFGVPGAAPFALLLGVLLIFGIQPGPDLITQQLDVVYFIVWSFAIASVLGAVLAFFMSRPLAKLSFVRFPVLAAALIPVLFMSGFQEPINLNVFYTMLLLGLIGWLCKITDVPRAPFLISYVLAIPLERYYFITVSIFEPSEWLSRPFVVTVVLLLVGTTAYSIIKHVRRSKVLAADGGDQTETPETTVMKVPPFVHLIVSVTALLFFIAAVAFSLGFSDVGRLFPLVVGSIGILICAVAIYKDMGLVRSAGGMGRIEGVFREELRTVAVSFLWMLGYVWLVFLFGMYVGTGIFALAFLLAVARTRILSTLLYMTGIVAALWALVEYGQLMLPRGWFL
ncbi:tripartite tricarboxylate transporter permease [Nocardiopsis nanhaiensis]